MENSTVGRVDLGAEVERNWGRNRAEMRTQRSFHQTPPCVDGCIKF